MAHKCNLIVDSCCDLPYEMLAKPGIDLLEFTYVMSDGDHKDEMYRSTTPAEFYGKMEKGEQPTTSQLSLPSLIGAFTKAAASGVPTVYLCFSSGLSGTYDVACMALDQVKADYPDAELYLVDTKLASIAEGLLVAEAIRQRDRGLTAEELAAWAEEARYYVNALFMIEDLEVLRRGGRIPGTVAFAGSKLDVKPMLTFDTGGQLSMAGMARGRKKGMKQLIELYKANSMDSGYGNIIITGNANAPKDAAKIRDMLHKENESLAMIDANVGPVIGSHVGPGMLALVFWGRDRREEMSVADRIASKVRGR